MARLGATGQRLEGREEGEEGMAGSGWAVAEGATSNVAAGGDWASLIISRGLASLISIGDRPAWGLAYWLKHIFLP
ncbi:hypothetical protein BHE74_00039857 [Ensete ventricosum]|nr:hypothetical protein BHE74_00039857 [Ensete ventricosum]